MHIISLKIVSVKSDQSYGLFNIINSIYFVQMHIICFATSDLAID